MKENSFGNELPIPEYVSLRQKLNCESCSNTDCNYSENSFNTCDPALDSIYSCIKIINTFSITKMILEGLSFVAFSIFSIHNFTGLWPTIFKIVIAFIALCIFDVCSELFIKFVFDKSEQIRVKKFDAKVKQIREENEAIRKANMGITKENEKLFDNSVTLYNELNFIFETINSKLDLNSKIEKRVVDKSKEVLNELKTLNSKLSIDNIESTYITTLYEIHLPKLLDYSKRFFEHSHSNILTQKEIGEFSNLLEVFRVKISDHAKYLTAKVEDDFVIKLKALNEDVIPDFDGNEVSNNE